MLGIMWQGHGQKIKSGLCSTKAALEVENAEAPALTKSKERTIFATTYDVHDDLERKMYTDQKGRFPIRLYLSHQYIMVLVELDGNRILVEPIKGKTSGDMVRSYNTLVNRLKSHGIKPKLHILDNECSKEFSKAIQKQGMRH